MYEGVESLVKDHTGGGKRVKVLEYDREGHTYHAKGMWVSWRSATEGMVDATMAGSSNFDRRGFERDLESEVSEMMGAGHSFHGASHLRQCCVLNIAADADFDGQ